MRTPNPIVVADMLDLAARQLREHGHTTRQQAATLAARGYPNSTLGNGGRSSDTTTPTERAALNPDPFADIDQQLTRTEHTLWALAERYLSLTERIHAHAPDDDPLPAGTGTCLRCERFCRPSGDRPENRIRAGYCPACYQRWVRAGRPDRPTFTRTTNEDVA